jgi:hypothetical protein
LPARAVSCLATGLKDNLGGIIIDGSYSKVAREKLHEKVMKAADLSATIVIDARHENTELLKLIDILQLSKLPARPYVLRREESESNRLGDQVHLKIDGLSVTEEQLLEALCLERPNRRDSSSTEPQ